MSDTTKRIDGLDCILLVDDDEITNLIHERVILDTGLELSVRKENNAAAALEYLEAVDADRYIKPGIIFLDINMPGMNGWEFLEAYDALPDHCKVRAVVVMLTTSVDPTDKSRADGNPIVHQYVNKVLTAEKLDRIISEHFSGSS